VVGGKRPSDILSSTNRTWNDPGVEPGLLGKRPATIRQS
jgi:hypothetical protein